MRRKIFILVTVLLLLLNASVVNAGKQNWAGTGKGDTQHERLTDGACDEEECIPKNLNVKESVLLNENEALVVDEVLLRLCGSCTSENCQYLDCPFDCPNEDCPNEDCPYDCPYDCDEEQVRFRFNFPSDEVDLMTSQEVFIEEVVAQVVDELKVEMGPNSFAYIWIHILDTLNPNPNPQLDPEDPKPNLIQVQMQNKEQVEEPEPEPMVDLGVFKEFLYMMLN